jgi:hypothetical protein
MKERVALEAVRHQYVVSFAGFYGEFRGKLLVGIEKKVLEKTDLIPYIDRVTVSPFGQATPAFLKEYFTVVPINEAELHGDESLLQQGLGLAVLPELAVVKALKIGDRIVLNAVLAKKMLMREKGGDPELWAQYVLKSYLKGKTAL